MKHNEPTVARSTALMSVATLASRVTGLARTFVMAAVIGNTLITSAYQVANNVPNLLYDLAAGGLLNAAFLPLYLLAMEKHGQEGGNRYASNLLNIVVLLMAVLAILGTIFAPQVIATQNFTQEFDSEVNAVAVDFFRIFAMQLLFYGIGGVVTSLLNAHRVFFLPSIAPAFNNIVVIISFVSYHFLLPVSPELAFLVLAIGTTLGVVVQMVVQIPALIKQGFKWEFRIDFKDPGLISTLKTGVPMMIFLVGMTIAFTFRNTFGFATGDNGPSTLNYAWIWFQLPHGVIAVSLSRALFTEMSKAAAADDIPAFARFMKTGITGTLFIMIPLAGLMCVLAQPIMQVFQMGRFTAEDVSYVGMVLSVWVIALPFYSLQMYLFNVFASLRRFGIFALVCTLSCIVQCILYAVLTAPNLLGILGICVADIAYYAITVIILLAVLRRIVGSVGAKETLITSAKSLLATLVGVGLVVLAMTFLPQWSGPLGGFAITALYGGVGLIVILALSRLLRIKEMTLITDLAKRFIKRS